jgi:hypothetical protein
MSSIAAGANDNGTAQVGANTPSRNRNSQQGRGGNRGRYPNRTGGSDNRSQQQHHKPKKFTGKEEALGDEFVYQHTEGRDATDQYARTTEEIIRYSSTKYKNGGDVERSLADGTAILFPMPPTPVVVLPAVALPEGDMMIWKMRVQQSLQRTSLLATNLESVYALIKGQCSKPILEKVEAMQGYSGVHQARDPIGLLGLIKGVMFNYNSKKYRATSLIDIFKPDLVSQTRFMSDSEYLEKFRTQLDVLKSAGGDVCNHHGMTEDELVRMNILPGAGTDAEIQAAAMVARKRFEAALFLVKSDQRRYGRLVQELANDYNKGRDSYPESLTAAYELMLHDVRDQDSVRPHAQGDGGMSFNVVGGGKVPGSNTQANPRPDITCHRCGKDGHFSGKCLEVKHANGTVLMNAAAVISPPQDSVSVLGDTVAGSVAPAANSVAMTIIGEDVDHSVHTFQFMVCGVIDQGHTTAHLLSQHKAMTGQTVPESWILLDNQSTVDVFSNKDLLTNIRQGPTTCRISCNAGTAETRMIGDLPGYPTPVWYHPKGIANILSLHRVSKYCRVAYDSTEDGASFHVTKQDGTVLRFQPSVSGLHFCDSREYGTTLINTVADKKSQYTKRACKQASIARRLQNVISGPSTRDFVKIVEGGMLRNCPISRIDISVAEDIHGPNLGSLKGKTVRRKNTHVPSLVADVPYHIIKTHKDVTLCFDIMFVNKIPFLVTVSRNIRFGTTERLLSRHAGVVGKALVTVLKFYRQRGFRVKECHGDGEFGPLRGTLADAQAHLNVTAEDEHVPEVERYIRTLKERTRRVYNTVPFRRMPGIMIVELVHGRNFWLNMFPANDGVSAVQSPRRIMTGQQADYLVHCQLEFGEYVQVHESHDNSMLTRTTGAIALRPTGNAQGGYYFMSLTTGKRLNRYAWTALPMPGEVIERVHALAGTNPAGGAILFGWRDGTEIADDPDDADDLHDEDYNPDDDDDDDADDDDTIEYGANDDDESAAYAPPLDAGVNDTDYVNNDSSSSSSDDENENENDENENENGTENNDEENNENEQGGDGTTVDVIVDDDDEPPALMERIPADDSDSDDDDDDDDDDTGRVARGSRLTWEPTLRVPRSSMRGEPTRVSSTGVATVGVRPAAGVAPIGVAPIAGVPAPMTTEAQMDESYGPRKRDGMRARKPARSGAKIKEPQTAAHHALMSMMGHELEGMCGFSDLEHVALTQYNVKRGLEKFGQAASDAVLKEMKQLHDRKTIRPRFSSDLTLQEKRNALAYLMFIKEKRCGTIKARGCADGRKQRVYKTKEETSSPTVRTESLMLSCVIDAKERRKVMTADVPGAFMQVDVDEVVHVRLVGPLAVLLTKVDPELYTEYLGVEHGKEVLYVQLQKALYGTLSAAMLFWKDLSGLLSDEGYEPNPYDCCVMNKMVNGNQSTILWHVDDLKISHVDEIVNEWVLEFLNARYGDETPLTVTRGDIHEYLGMTIDYGTDGKVIIRMDDYVENMLEELPEDMSGVAVTPAAAHLFKVDDTEEDLNKEGSELFHSITAKLLFLCKRARPDIQTPIAFLCTRVMKPNAGDYTKLRRVISYLRGTKRMCLTLEADDLQVIKWWIDASFAVHEDMRSHTGGTMSLGKGSVYSTSIRQKLTTKSSTEAELVGVDDVMPQVLWTRQFMEGQGYVIRDNIVYQDNTSAMLLEKNGQQSSTKRTRHLDIRYFFVTDRIKAKQLTVEYCPTGDMWADPFTKPLQGAAFQKFRKLILNLD